MCAREKLFFLITCAVHYDKEEMGKAPSVRKACTQEPFLVAGVGLVCPSIPPGLLSWGLIRHMCKVSDRGQEWLWTRDTQWNQVLDLGLISNGIKPTELIAYRHFTPQ